MFRRNEGIQRDRLADANMVFVTAKTYNLALEIALHEVPNLQLIRTILELGCGGGSMTLAEQQKFPAAKITAVDIDDILVGEARNENTTFISGKFVDVLPTIPTQSVDLAVLANMGKHHGLGDKALEHIYSALTDEHGYVLTLLDNGFIESTKSFGEHFRYISSDTYLGTIWKKR